MARAGDEVLPNPFLVDNLGYGRVTTATHLLFFGLDLGKHRTHSLNMPFLAAVRRAHEREIRIVKSKLIEAFYLEESKYLNWLRS
ncbi:hypothetical protein COL940_012014 [Colletotrichum noveboracense]|nr:hypothetical protein COL940_012014 [Colletotrichum noveboracense]